MSYRDGETIRERAAYWMRLALSETGTSRTELARRMHVSRPYVTKLLKGDENLTIGQLERVLDVLGFDLSICIVTRPQSKPRERK